MAALLVDSSQFLHAPAPQIPGSVQKNRGFTFHPSDVESTQSQPSGGAMQRTGGINPVPDRMDLRGGEGRSISWRWTPGCFRGPSRPNLPCAWVTLPGTSRHGPYAVDCRVRNKAAGPRSTDPAPHRNEWLHCLHGAGDHLSRAMSAAVHLLPLPTRSLPLPRRTLSPVDPSTTTPTPSGPNRGSPGV